VAKIGYLMLRGGRWEGRPVVSEAWVRASVTPHVLRPRGFGSHPVDYGYLWWLLPAPDGRGAAIYTASGALGQWIFVDPAHDLVVVVLGHTSTGAAWVAPADFLYSHILPALR
jgi:CubicO group peptidase (beta-lactamase class C family)